RASVTRGQTYSPRKTTRTAASKMTAPRVSLMPPPPAARRRSCLADQRDDLGLEALDDLLHLAVDQGEIGEVGEALELVGLVEVAAQFRTGLGLAVGGAGADGPGVVLVVRGAQAEVRELLGQRGLRPPEDAPALRVVEPP